MTTSAGAADTSKSSQFQHEASMQSSDQNGQQFVAADDQNALAERLTNETVDENDKLKERMASMERCMPQQAKETENLKKQLRKRRTTHEGLSEWMQNLDSPDDNESENGDSTAGAQPTEPKFEGFATSSAVWESVRHSQTAASTLKTNLGEHDLLSTEHELDSAAGYQNTGKSRGISHLQFGKTWQIPKLQSPQTQRREVPKYGDKV